jgi:hypothetical protein
MELKARIQSPMHRYQNSSWIEAGFFSHRMNRYLENKEGAI